MTNPMTPALQQPINSGEKSANDKEVLIHAENVGKIFCRNLKRSFLYGAIDGLRDLNPSSIIASKLDQERVLRPGEFWANQNINFEVRRGECLALVGHNGAGKTTLLKMLNGLIKPDTGRIRIRGRVSAMIALGAGFNPILSGRENIYVNGSILSLSRREIDQKLDEIVAFAELEEFIDSPIQNYSSGMQVRLGFAVAASLYRPDVMIIDEVLAVGDAAFRTKCLIKISELLEHAAVILVSHQENIIGRISDRVIWLEKGEIFKQGSTTEVLPSYIARKTTSSDDTKRSIIKGTAISDFEANPPTQNVSIGEEISIQIDFTGTREEQVQIISLGIAHETDGLIGQCDTDHHFTLLPGKKTRLKLTLPELRLKTGNYRFHFSAFRAEGKILIFRVTQAFECFIQCDQSPYACYVPILRVSSTSYDIEKA